MKKIKNNVWRHVLQLGVIAVIAGFIRRSFNALAVSVMGLGDSVERLSVNSTLPSAPSTGTGMPQSRSRLTARGCNPPSSQN